MKQQREPLTLGKLNMPLTQVAINYRAFETFASTSLLNFNGLKPEQAVTGPDDQGTVVACFAAAS
jgi:hypothetical protein